MLRGRRPECGDILRIARRNTGARNGRITAAALACAHLGVVSVAAGQVGIREIPLLPLPNLLQSSGEAVTPDGSKVVGYCGYTNSVTLLVNAKPIEWTVQGGTVTPAGFPANRLHATFHAVSGNGQVAAGFGYDGAFTLRTPAGFQFPSIGSSDQPRVQSVSRDGTTVVGFVIPSFAFRWTATGGFQTLPGANAWAMCVSEDGRVIGGRSSAGATRWVDGVAHHFTESGSGEALTPDGLTMVGWSGIPGQQTRAWRWTFGGLGQELPTAIELPVTAGPDLELRACLALGVSDDGSVIVGRCHTNNPAVPVQNQVTAAVIWTDNLGAVDLNRYLPAIGIDLTGWDLRRARGVSANGRVIAGNGFLNGQARGFVLTLPDRLCATADFNNDGDTGTDQDIEAFFACLGGNCCGSCFPTADFNGDGDAGTDQDIESFFRVLGGHAC